MIRPLVRGSINYPVNQVLKSWARSSHVLLDTPQVMELSEAIDSVEPKLKDRVQLGAINHPIGSAVYLVARISIH